MTPEKTIAGGLLVALFTTVGASAQELRGALDTTGAPVAAGWYLRADVGLNAPGSGDPSQADLASNGGRFIDHSMTRTGSLAVGAGYRFSPNIRLDATLELRSGSTFKAVDNVRITNGRGQTAADIYSLYDATVESQVAMVTGYYDFTTWRGLTPFVGASIGLARNTVTGLTSANQSTVNLYSNVAPYDLTSQLAESSSSYSNKKTLYNFAWGLTAGAGYAVSDRLTIEGAYRYLNLGGSAASDMINCTCGSNGQPLKVGTIDSHDLKVGLRWALDDPAPAPRAATLREPVIAKY